MTRGLPLRRAITSSITWLGAQPTGTAGGLFALFVLAYMWPVLIGGDILSPAAALYQGPPWSSVAPADLTDFINFMLGDVPMSHYPWNDIARDAIRSGTLPTWSQHAYAGTPFFANPQAILLSPFAIPLWILPLNYGLGVMAAIKLWLAAFGMYLLVRELRLSFWPGILAGVSYGLCAFNVVWLTHETLVAVAAMLPWLVLLVERIVRTGRPWPAIGLALVTAVALTGGHPGTELHVMIATAVYALVRALDVYGLSHSERAKRLAIVFGSLLLGAMLVAVLLVPVIKAGAGTLGAEGRRGGNTSIPGGDLPFDALRTALFPDWWGRPSALSLDGPPNYNERTFYGGGVAAILAALALIAPGAWRRKAPFIALALIGIAVPLHAPVFYWLASNLPLIEQVQNQRMLLLFVFAVPVLGAFGLQRLIDAPEDRMRPWSVLGAAGLVGLLALSSGAVSGADLNQAVENIVRFRHAVGGLVVGTPPNRGGMVATSVGWWIVLVIGVAGAVLAVARWPRRLMVIAAALAAFAAVDVLYFARDYQPMAPAAKVLPPRTPAIAYLQRHADDGRFVAIDSAMANGWLARYGIRDVRGYDPPQPSLRYYHLWRVLNFEQSDWAQFVTPMPDAGGLNVLSVLGARYIATDPSLERPAELPGLSVGYSGDDAKVFVNDDAVPRAMVAPRVVVVGDEHDAVGTIASEDFDPRRDVVVERSDGAAAKLQGSSGHGGSARVTDETHARVTLLASLERPGLVVLNDQLAPGWSVTVDGESAPAVRANSVMRGVIVDEGQHEVVWSYRVPGARSGLAVSGLGLVLLVGSIAFMVVGGRRQRKDG